MKSDYLISLAHEIRNPLTNINMSISGLESELLDEATRPYLDIIRRSSLRISNLICELILLSQTEENEENVENYSVQQLLDEVIDMARDRFLLKHVTISREFSEEDLRIDLNRNGLKNALTNIIINGLEAIAGENGELIFRTYSLADKYIVQIEDNGCGIDTAELGNIFEAYYTNKSGGLGIGLASAQSFLLSNHVDINVVSDIGIGTRFVLLFRKD
jgi:signal transduction histidine kinase